MSPCRVLILILKFKRVRTQIPLMTLIGWVKAFSVQSFTIPFLSYRGRELVRRPGDDHDSHEKTF